MVMLVDGGGASAGKPAIQTAAKARTAYREPASPAYRKAVPLARAIGLKPAAAAATEAHFTPTGAPTPPPVDIPAPAPVYAPPPTRTTGSGRSAAIGGSGLAPVPAAFVPPESITAAPAVAQAPAVVAEAPPSAINVPGQSFTSVGTPGTFGQMDRLRQSRGPTTGLSVTPEMIRRAAASRLG